MNLLSRVTVTETVDSEYIYIIKISFNYCNSSMLEFSQLVQLYIKYNR